MTLFHSRARLLGATMLAAVSVSPAFAEEQAQTAAQPATAAQPVATSQPAEAIPARRSATVVVTGSRIGNPNLTSVVPVISIGADNFLEEGPSSVGDTLNELPQLRSTVAQQNPGLGIGVAGLNLLDLRGLGTVRTLVLVNGRRHVGSNITGSGVGVDITTIPSDLIERTDIVTGGNSAVYGSDAIAGVVNFVLRSQFDGFQFRTQGGVATEGYGAGGQVSAMWGRNFDDGNGNITLHGEYGYQSRVFGEDVPWLQRNDNLLVVDVDTAGLPNGSDGVPDRSFFTDIRSTTISRFGLVPVSQGNAALCGLGLGATNGPAGTAGGLPYNCTFIFDENGNLSAQTGTRRGTGINSSITGGNGPTGREGEGLSVLPQLERYNFNLLTRYGTSELAEVYFEAKAARSVGRGNNAGPTFIQGGFGQFDIRERFRLDNPYLNAAARTTLTNAILASGCNTSFFAGCVTATGAPAARSTFGGQGVAGPLNAADIAAINAGTYRFNLGRNLLDAGIRDEDFTRDTLRFVGGIRGTFNEDWNYDLSFNYGRFTEEVRQSGFVDRQRFMLSLDAGRNPATGQIQCRSQFDAASRVAFTQGLSATTAAANLAKLDADIAACAPYNPFGQGDNAAARNYFERRSLNESQITQSILSGFVSGDLSQWFELQGGPIGFAFGGEWRAETAYQQQDAYLQTGATNAVVFPTYDPPTFEVREVFAELRIPLLADLPFAHELTVSGAGRRSQYSEAIGEVDTYNYGVVYAPVEDLRLRANFGRAVRAPNLSETSASLVPNFANGFIDPCAPAQLANNPNRLPNCQADLGALLPTLLDIGRSLPVLSGSNPLLEPEVSDSWTYGFVFQPRFIEGLTLSVDYYDIEVQNVIVALGAQTIANLCYDQASLNNQFCALFTRWRGPGLGPLGETPGQVQGNTLIQSGVNFAKRIRRGIDLQLEYEREFGRDWKFEGELLYTHNEQISNFNDPIRPNFEDRILSELGDPEDEFRVDLDLSKGNLTFGYSLRYIGPMVINAWEDTNALDSACTPAGCPPNNLDFADILEYDSVVYHGIRVQYDIETPTRFGDRIRLFAGIENVADTLPPLGLTAVGAGSAIYDVRGRVVYGGVRTRF